MADSVSRRLDKVEIMLNSAQLTLARAKAELSKTLKLAKRSACTAFIHYRHKLVATFNSAFPALFLLCRDYFSR